MAEAERSTDPRELYKQAVLEPDPEKLAGTSWFVPRP